MKQYNVTGMSCASCSNRVEKAVLKVEGVTGCTVNLLTNSLSVEGTASPTQIITAVEKAGYGATLKQNIQKNDNVTAVTKINANNTKSIKVRLFVSIALTLALTYFSMGQTMLNLPLPTFFSGNYIAIAIIQMLIAIAVIIINKRFFTSGFKAIINKSPNMDTLVAMGSSCAFIYSLCVLFLMTKVAVYGDYQGVLIYFNKLYFESSATILTLVCVGKTLELRSRDKTLNALNSLIKLSPEKATLVVGEKFVQVLAKDVKVGDVFIVRPGESIAVDGIVIDGFSSVNQCAITGESMPVDKKKGDYVSCATININGVLYCKATKVGEDTTLSQIIKLVSDAQTTKAPISKIADRVSGIFVPIVMLIAVITLICWLIAGKDVGFSLARSISVLVISCPCALGLATPVAIMVSSGVGAKNGILFKNATAIEQAGKITTVVLDKTGTVTYGIPKVTDVIPFNGFTKQNVIDVAYSLEKNSQHPIANAITNVSERQKVNDLQIQKFTYVSGNGLYGYLDKDLVFGGNLQFVTSKGIDTVDINEHIEKLSNQGKTPVIFGKNKQIMGIVAVADSIKQDSKQAILQLKKMGIKVVMLTGDNKNTALAIAKQVDIDNVIADVLPQEKSSVVLKLKEQNKKNLIAMVGDGINDAPALANADVGIAIGNGADIAVDVADIVLMKNSLNDIPALIKLSKKTLLNIKENLFWAFCYNCLCIPLASGVFIPLLNLQLNPMFGALAMGLSSFCVVSNALRLNFFKIYNNTKLSNNIVKEVVKMQKTLIIKGMMCTHCEKAVKKALEGLNQVDFANVDFASGKAIVTLNAPIENGLLKNVVEEQDYEVVSVE